MSAPDDSADRFAEIWLWCLLNCVGTLPSGPCSDCIQRYAKNGPHELNIGDAGARSATRAEVGQASRPVPTPSEGPET